MTPIKGGEADPITKRNIQDQHTKRMNVEQMMSAILTNLATKMSIRTHQKETETNNTEPTTNLHLEGELT